jgi:hypothetical protein
MDKNPYEDPEPRQDTKARAIAILALAIAVVIGMVLLATGVVQVR